VVAEIVKNGGRAQFLAADMSDGAAVAQLAAAAQDVDVLVNNAGVSWFGPTADLEPAEFDALFAANVGSAYHLVAALGPKMAQRGQGSIVNLSSMAGQIGLPAGAAYGATKAALAAMTRAWAAEFSPSGVRVNAVAPGPVYTAADTDRTAALGRTTLLGRAAQALIPADGGRTAV
jgi:NAD(P)-dependent dehydrogenase (short-subunit alcohol dehydrogenase family)